MNAKAKKDYEPIYDDDGNRVLTDQDILNYDRMVESFVRDYVVKNWNEANYNRRDGEVVLGNTGHCLNDIRQQLRTEVCVALKNYNPNFRTDTGQSVKESTFVHRHLYFRVGQLMKRLTNKTHGYGVWTSRLENVLNELDEE